MVGPGSKLTGAGEPDPVEADRSLSLRLLALVVCAVMGMEILIYFPSAGRYWQTYMDDVLQHGRLAAEAAETLAPGGLSPRQQKKLLSGGEIHSVMLRRRDGTDITIAVPGAPEPVQEIDLRAFGLTSSTVAAFSSMIQGEGRILRVRGEHPAGGMSAVEVVMDETLLRGALIDYSDRILALSVLISVFTAAFLLLFLRYLVIAPLQRITKRIAKFRADPESPTPGRKEAARVNEIGAAENELIRMQDEFRRALRQRTRLAALGAAMGKINHSLRNTLTTAVMASDVLSALPDPEVKQITQRLANAVQRAVMLCGSAMNFAAEAEPPFNPSQVKLRTLVKQVFAMTAEAAAGRAGKPAVSTVNRVETLIKIRADRDQIFRALYNLVENALQAGARRIEIDAILQRSHIEITVKDNGPGINPHLLGKLFSPLFDVNRTGGAGLGLVAVRDVARAHGGGVEVSETGPAGTVFSLKIPRNL